MKIAFHMPGSIRYSDYNAGLLLGIEYQIFGLAKELIKLNYDVYIIRRWWTNSLEGTNAFHIFNLRTPEFSDDFLYKPITKAVYSKYSAAHIDLLRPDLLILNDLFASFFLLRCRAQKIFVTHNGVSDLSPTSSSIKKITRKFLEFQFFDRCSTIVSLNPSIDAYLKSYGYTSELIPNGVQTDDYVPDYYEGDYILYIGRFVKLKRIDDLIRAYSKIKSGLRKKYPLIIAGSGPEEYALKSLSLQLGLKNNVFFLPWLTKKQQIKKLQKAAMIVLPSCSECSNVSILEAMACGKPVIATSIPGIKEKITNMYNGILFEVNNVEQMRQSIELLLENPSLQLDLGRAARITVEQKFAFNKIADQYDHLIKKIAASNLC